MNQSTRIHKTTAQTNGGTKKQRESPDNTVAL